MKGMFIRMLIAAVCVVAFWYMFPAFLAILGVSLNGNLETLLKGAIAIVAIWYVFWGPSTWPTWGP
jgi:hypothetical protein